MGLLSFLASVRGLLSLSRTASGLLSRLDLEITPRRVLRPSALVFCSLSRRAGREHGGLFYSDVPPLALRRARAHLFFACSNALVFFIGQQREALGRLTLYEFDFGLERDGSYQQSLSLPIAARPVDEAHEVHDDSSV